jgi:3D (Asp-Asp-Asp) domain-containing protein
MRNGIIWLYASISLLAGIAAFQILSPSNESASGSPTAASANASSQPAGPSSPEVAAPGQPGQAELPADKVDALPAQNIDLSAAEQKAASEMQIAPAAKRIPAITAKEAATSGPDSKSAPSSSSSSEPVSGATDNSECRWTKTFLSTAYGPPWSKMEGGPITSSGKALVPNRYYVAADLSVLPLHSKIRINPSPFGSKQIYSVEDVGSAIKGNHIDIFVWNQSVRDSWKKNVQVCLVK